MKNCAIALFAALVLGVACKSNEWDFNRRAQQMRDAAAHAEAVGDFKPYPDGWPSDALPLHRDPKIAKSINLGQTMAEVAKVMGRDASTNTESRTEFVNHIHHAYAESHSCFKAPEDADAVVEQLPAQGRFAYWQYQGFPSTADWLVVFFASSDEQGSEPRVVSRGVLRLGDF